MIPNGMYYTHEETGVSAQWHGGMYVNLGHFSESDEEDQFGRTKYDFIAYEVLSVQYADTTSGASIPFTEDALKEAVDAYFVKGSAEKRLI